MRFIERSFSDLLRHPKEVTDDLAEGDVLLRRRDEPDLRLTLADRDTARASALISLGRTLRNLAIHSPNALANALTDAFPWLEFLPVKDRLVFVEEFSRAMVASTDLDIYAPLGQLVREWRATAEIHADPRLVRRLKRPLQAEGQPIALPAG